MSRNTPPELIAQIIDWAIATRKQDPAARFRHRRDLLLKFSLVNSDWRALAQRALCRYVVVQTLDGAAQLLDMLVARPDLAASVREMVLDRIRQDNRAADEAFHARAHTFLTLCSNTTILQVRGREDSSAQMSTDLLTSGGALSCCIFHERSFVDFPIIASRTPPSLAPASHLTHLTLSLVTIPGTLLTSTALPSLLHLALGIVWVVRSGRGTSSSIDLDLDLSTLSQQLVTLSVDLLDIESTPNQDLIRKTCWNYLSDQLPGDWIRISSRRGVQILRYHAFDKDGLDIPLRYSVYSMLADLHRASRNLSALRHIILVGWTLSVGTGREGDSSEELQYELRLLEKAFQVHGVALHHETFDSKEGKAGSGTSEQFIRIMTEAQ